MPKANYRIKAYKHPRLKFVVRTKINGTWERKFFPTKGEAQTYVQLKDTELLNQGKEAVGFPSSLRVMAQQAHERLQQFEKTITDAVNFYITHLESIQKSAPLSQAIEELIENRKASGASKRYCYDLKLRLGRFSQKFANRIVGDISTREIDEWLASLKLAPVTRNTFRRDLRTLFSFCSTRGYTSGNPVQATTKAKVVSGAPGILTVAQSIALLNACEADTLPFVAISLFAGLRAAEMDKLDWSEVDLEGGHVEVTASKAKTARRRLIPISENLAAWIQPLASRKGSVVPVGLRKKFDGVKARAGLTDWPPNAMRHSFASYRLAHCQDAARVSLEMGNSPAMVFAHYRELVREKEAARFWKIMPSADAKKVIAFTAK
jgi:integrase